MADSTKKRPPPSQPSPLAAKRSRPSQPAAASGSAKRQKDAAAGTSVATSLPKLPAVFLTSPSLPVAPSLGPILQVQANLAEERASQIVMNLQSGILSEVAWALNALQLITFAEKDNSTQRGAGAVAAIPGLLSALVSLVGSWRWGSSRRKDVEEFIFAATSNSQQVDGAIDLTPLSERIEHFDEWTRLVEEGEQDGWLNADEDGREERLRAASSAANALRNASFLPDTAAVMAAHVPCLELLFQILRDWEREDDDIITSAADIVVNLSPFMDLRIFPSSSSSASAAPSSAQSKLQSSRAASDSERTAVEPQSSTPIHQVHGALLALLHSDVASWHSSAAEALARLVANPAHDSLLLPIGPQVYPRLVELMSVPDVEVRAAAVAAVANFADTTMSAKHKLAAVPRLLTSLLRIVRNPGPMPEVGRKAAEAIESIAAEPRSAKFLLELEGFIVQIAFSDSKDSDRMARVLWLLSRDASEIESFHGPMGSIWAAEDSE